MYIILNLYNADECVEQTPRSGLGGSVGDSQTIHTYQTWYLLTFTTLDQLYPYVIFPISVSSCSGEKFRVMTDSVFVSCFTFSPSGNPCGCAFSIYPGSTTQQLLNSKSLLSLINHPAGLSTSTLVLLQLILSMAILILLKTGQIMLFFCFEPFQVHHYFSQIKCQLHS